MTTTDANGRAVVPNSRPVGKGSFRIQVKVDYQGMTTTSSFAQTNFATAAAATAAGATAGAGAVSTGLSTAAIAAIVAGAAAVVVGVAVAVTRGSKAPTGTIGSPGSPSITAP